MKSFVSILAAAAALTVPVVNGQVSLSLQPSPQTISAGDSTTLDLIISGLGSFSGPSLAGFDIDLNYNPAVIAASSLVFANYLDLGAGQSISSYDLSNPGLIHLDEVSLATSIDLNNIQPDTFRLATLAFTGLVAGSSAIDFVDVALSDESGTSINSFSAEGALIQVRDNGTSPVPEGGPTGSILAVGVLCLSAFGKRFSLQQSVALRAA